MGQASVLDLMLLGLVLEKPRSAYSLGQDMQRDGSLHWVKMSIPSIYKKVCRLAEQGYLRGNSDSSGRLAKTVYTITPEGRARFEQLMLEIAANPVYAQFDLNAVILNLDKISPQVALAEFAEIRKRTGQSRAAILRRIESSTVKKPLERALLGQQLAVLDALLKWMGEFSGEYARTRTAK